MDNRHLEHSYPLWTGCAIGIAAFAAWHHGVISMLAGTPGLLSMRDVSAALAGHAILLLKAAAVFIAAYGFGRKIWPLFGISTTASEELVFSTGLGLGLFGYLTLASGFIGLLSPAGCWGILIIGVAFAAFDWPSALAARAAALSSASAHPSACCFSALRAGLRDIFPSRVGLAGLLLAIPVTFALAHMLCTALAPPVIWDSYLYHLPGPRRFLDLGRIWPVRWETETIYSMHLETVWTLAMAVGGERLPGLLGLGIAALWAAAVRDFGRRYFSPAAGALAAAVLLCSPAVCRFAPTPYSDTGAAFLVFLGIYLFALAWFSRAPAAFFASGLYLGLGAACRYNALGPPVIAFCAALFACFRRRRIACLREIAMPLALGCLLGGGYIYIRNAAVMHNPVWYYMGSIFSGLDWHGMATWLSDRDIAIFGTGPALRDLLWAPFGLILNADVYSMQYGEREMGLVCLVALFGVAAALFKKSQNPSAAKFSVGFLAGLFLLWFATYRSYRAFFPAYGIAAVLAGYGIASLARAWRPLGIALALLAFLPMRYLTSHNEILANLAARSLTRPDLSTRQRYILHSHDCLDDFNFLNGLPGVDRVAMLYEFRCYLAARPTVWVSPWWGLLDYRMVQSHEELREELRRRSVTHLFANWRGAQYDLADPALAAHVRRLYDGLIAHSACLYRSGDREIFKL